MSTVQTPLCSNRACAAKIVLIHVKFGNELEKQESDFCVAKVSYSGDHLDMNYNFWNISCLKAQNYLKTNKQKKKVKTNQPNKTKNHKQSITKILHLVFKCVHITGLLWSFSLLLNLPLPVFLFGHEVQILV